MARVLTADRARAQIVPRARAEREEREIRAWNQSTSFPGLETLEWTHTGHLLGLEIFPRPLEEQGRRTKIREGLVSLLSRWLRRAV